MYFYALFLSTLVAIVVSEHVKSDNIDNILRTIFSQVCTRDDGEIGMCVTYDQCLKNGTLVLDGRGSRNPSQQQGTCTNHLNVCCLQPDYQKPSVPIEPKESLQSKFQTRGCGWRNSNGVGLEQKALSNDKAKFGEFPWTVSILRKEAKKDMYKDKDSDAYVGGGSVIHQSVVLTAAHIISGHQSFYVRAGEWDTQTTDELYPHQDRDVEEIVVHKNFNSANLFNDIALLFLDKHLDSAPNVGIVCLPPPNFKPADGSRCISSGWGKNTTRKGAMIQTTMKKVELPAIDRNICEDVLRSTRLGRYFQLNSSFMCAGGETDKDTCQGDGGSPLVCPIEYQTNRYMQSGIVAWGINCGKTGTPGVYTDVSNFRQWIDENIIRMGYHPGVYTY